MKVHVSCVIVLFFVRLFPSLKTVKSMINNILRHCGTFTLVLGQVISTVAFPVNSDTLQI